MLGVFGIDLNFWAFLFRILHISNNNLNESASAIEVDSRFNVNLKREPLRASNEAEGGRPCWT